MGKEIEARRRLFGRALRQAGWVGALVAILVAAAVMLPGPIVGSMLKHDVQVQSGIWRDRIVSHLTATEDTFAQPKRDGGDSAGIRNRGRGGGKQIPRGTSRGLATE